MFDNFYILGLPITEDSISDKFLNFINSKEPTIYLISSKFNLEFKTRENQGGNDYNTTKVGFDKLIDSGVKFIDDVNEITDDVKNYFLSLNLWSKFGRDVPNINKMLIYLYDMITNLKKYNCRIVYISLGSPYLYDSICDQLIQKIPSQNIIDTKSSSQLSYELIAKQNNLPLYMIDKDKESLILKKNAINVIGCIGSIYTGSNWRKDVDSMLNTLNDDSLIYDIKLGYENQIKRLEKQEFVYILKQSRDHLNSSTIAIIP